MRIFIAFPVGKSIQNEARDLMQSLQKKYQFVGAKWVAPSNMHVTLEFLGAINERQLAQVREILLYQTKKVLPFLYSIAGISVFPNENHPETLVLSVMEVDTAFSVLLRKALHEELALYNFSNDFKLWRPHITLARLKNTEKVSVKNIAETPVEKQIWQVNIIQLISSQLTAHGSKYTVLETFTLG